MDFSFFPYDQLPQFIRDNEQLRQVLLQSGGIIKYVAEHIDDPDEEDRPMLFVQYQNYVAENYRRANRWNPMRQGWSDNVLRQRALDDDNHIWPEFQSRTAVMHALRKIENVPHVVRNMVDILTLNYLSYAWKEDLRRRHPDIDSDLGTYRYVMKQFEEYPFRRFEGLACRSIDIAIKIHHEEALNGRDIHDLFNIEEFHHHFFNINGRMQRGIKRLLAGKTVEQCRAEAVNMIKKAKWFSQHVYNDEAVDVLSAEFSLEDKRWLRNIMEHYNRDGSEEELNFFYFGKLLADVGHLWNRQLYRYAKIDLSELERETNSFVNTEPTAYEITWEQEKMCFKNAVLHVMEKKKYSGDFLFEKPTQWMAVYRFAVDIGIMYDVDDPKNPEDSSTPQYKAFEDFALELQLDVNPPTRIPFTKDHIKDIKKPNYARYNTPYPWSTDGINHARSFELFTIMDDVYRSLKEEFNNNVSAFERVVG